MYVVVMAFMIGGVIWGTPVTILSVCGGFGGECPPDEYIGLNPAAGLLVAATVALALTVLDLIMRRRQQ